MPHSSRFWSMLSARGCWWHKEHAPLNLIHFLIKRPTFQHWNSTIPGVVTRETGIRWGKVGKGHSLSYRCPEQKVSILGAAHSLPPPATLAPNTHIYTHTQKYTHARSYSLKVSKVENRIDSDVLPAALPIESEAPLSQLICLTDHMSMAIILKPLKINLRWTMKNGNLAPTLHSLCLCMRWQGDTRSALQVTPCFCGINTIHLLHFWILGQGCGCTYAWACESARGEIPSSELSGSP